MLFITKEEKLTEEMLRYETETGKKAIWRNAITEGFKKWQRGEEIYGIDKKGIGILVSDETKEKWQNFADEKSFSTISKFIRKAVNSYIENSPKSDFLKDISRISHDLKEPLTTIQGFSQLIIDYESNNLNPNILTKIKEILNQSKFLENTINQLVYEIEPEKFEYDILIIEDNPPAITILDDFFESKNLTCKGVLTGNQGLDELKNYKPKIILLDIILPDISGYEICKKIKFNDDLKDIPVFYVTAVPESEVKKKLIETGADGYFLKPFKFNQLESLLSLI